MKRCFLAVDPTAFVEADEGSNGVVEIYIEGSCVGLDEEKPAVSCMHYAI